MISRRAILTAPLPIAFAAPAAARLVPSPASAPIGRIDGLFAPGGVGFDFSTPGVLPAGATFTRASLAWSTEGANSIRNPTGVNGVAGTPGTAPTNWSLTTTANGITRTIVGFGAEDGIPYVDIRFFGTPTNSSSISIAPDGFIGTPAFVGQTWIGSYYFRLMAGSFTNAPLTMFTTERTSGGSSLVSTGGAITPTGAPLRTQLFSFTRTFDQITAAGATCTCGNSYTLGNALDFTLRIGLPRLVRSDVNDANFNWIRNPTGIGPATPTASLPTNWGSGGTIGALTRTVVATGIEGGIPYTDIQWVGTPSATSSNSIEFDGRAVTPCVIGQTWTQATSVRVVGGSMANVGSRIQVVARTSDGITTVESTTNTIVPTSAPLSGQRNTQSRTLTGAASAMISCSVTVDFTIGLPIDITLRIGNPTLTLAAPIFLPQLYAFNNDAPRWAYDRTTSLLRGMHNEPAATNGIRNASALGAVPGSPGTPPTFWGLSTAANGVTRTIVGSGTEDGIPYFDVQFAGTPSANTSFFLTPEGNTIAALVGQTWTASCFARLVAGSLANTVHTFRVSEVNAGGTAVAASATVPAAAPTAAPLRTQQLTVTRLFTDATTAWANCNYIIATTSGLAVDLTLRFAAPQVVQANAQTSPILSTAAAVTRAADVLSLPLANGLYSIAVARESGTTTYPAQSVTTGAWLVPNDPSPLVSVTASR